MIVASAGAAVADTVSNDLDATVDASLETLYIQPGATATVNFTVNATNGDGKTGCNFGAFTLLPPARLVVAIGGLPPGIASFSPSSLTFTQCGVPQAVTVTGGATEGTALAGAVPTFTNTLTVFNTIPSGFTVVNDGTDPSVNCGTADGFWHADNVSIPCTASDGLSGLADGGDASFDLTTTVADGDETDDAATGTRAVLDLAGNSTTAGPIGGNKVDRKDPTGIAFSGSFVDGTTYPAGSVPAEPTCSATDGGSGLDDCVVTGYSTAIGAHTLTATATDNVGNSDTKTLSYTVSWATKGFYQPVDMGGVLNTVKAGSTVPLKFELFDDVGEITDTAAVLSLTSAKFTCNAGTPTDAIETVSTGRTSLRYDGTAGQFLYNWKVPSLPGTCHQVTMTTTNGPTISALFKLK